ncbi:MAG: hypothetical protein FWH42_05695, partial [Dehalococcoidia bacterium]|nr:hypothetical protein [Dehalococcoidia bacterium]
MKQNKIIFVFLCILMLSLSLSTTRVAADSPATPIPFQVIFDEGKKIFYYTPDYYTPEDSETLPKTGLYYNTSPLINIYYIDERDYDLGYGIFEGSTVFSSDGMQFAHFPWASNTGVRQPWGFGCLSYNSSQTGTAILFFDNGRRIKEYQVSDLLKDVSKGTISASHIIWQKSREFDSEQNILTVDTLDNHVYRFDLS